MPDLIPVLLPFGKKIHQHKNGQLITGDSAELVRLILSETGEEPKTVLDAGSGTGIIAIMLSHYRPEWLITGLEYQNKLVELARDNNKHAGTSVEFITGDLREFPDLSRFDIVVINPPYYLTGDGMISNNKERALSRCEIECTMSDVTEVVGRMIKKDGYGYIVYPETRRGEFHEKAEKEMLIIVSETIIGVKKKKIIYKIMKKQ